MVCIIDRHREYEWEDREDARMYEKSYYISVDPGGNDAIELNSPDLTWLLIMPLNNSLVR